MAISVDWPTKVITVPKADTTLVDIGPPEIRSLDVDQFRKDLNALQAGEVGIVFDTTHTHKPPVTISGITLARVVELVNGYTITFENGAYAVNLTGANNNVSDVVNLNTVSIRSANSAGLIEGSTIEDVLEGSMTVGDALRVILAASAGKLSGAATTNVKIRDQADSKDRIDATVDASGNRSAITVDGS